MFFSNREATVMCFGHPVLVADTCSPQRFGQVAHTLFDDILEKMAARAGNERRQETSPRVTKIQSHQLCNWVLFPSPNSRDFHNS